MTVDDLMDVLLAMPKDRKIYLISIDVARPARGWMIAQNPQTGEKTLILQGGNE